MPESAKQVCKKENQIIWFNSEQYFHSLNVHTENEFNKNYTIIKLGGWMNWVVEMSEQNPLF